MSWNGSDIKKQKSQGIGLPKPTVKNRFAIRHVVIGAVTILIAASCWFFSCGKDPEGKSTVTRIRAKAIADFGTNVIRSVTNEASSAPSVEIRKLGNGMIMKYVNGKEAWLYPREDYHGPVITTKVNRVKSLAEKTFKNRADRQIASLLMLRPGSTIMGEPNYSKTFVRDFLASYKEPFYISPEDTESQKELKRMVAEVKGDLKARMEAGEDIAQIMKDTRSQLRELCLYKRELMQHVRSYAKQENVTEQDYQDYVTAANRLLSDRGIEPIRVNGFLKHQLNLLRNAKERKDEQP